MLGFDSLKCLGTSGYINPQTEVQFLRDSHYNEVVQARIFKPV
ncbi:hypothetical protein VPHD239_0086 [Vibrio phage D239]